MYVHIIYVKQPRVGTKPANTFAPMADWSTWSKHTRAADWHNFALLLNLPLDERPKPVIPGVLFHLLRPQFRKKLHASHLGHVSRPSKEEIVWMRSGTYNGDSWKRRTVRRTVDKSRHNHSWIFILLFDDIVRL